MDRSRTAVFALLILALLSVTSPAVAQDVEAEPGTAPPAAPSLRALQAPAPASPVAPIVTDAGRISLSVDAIGTNSAAGASVNVEKPVAGTVRSAYLAAASTGFSQYQPADGDVTIGGVPVSWDAARTMTNGIGSVNVWADVTNIVKPALDAAAPGIVSFTVAEGANTSLIDGAILAVVFDDPTAVRDRGIVLAYGAQQVTGDRIRLVRLPDEPLTNVSVELGVGISFGFQPTGQDSAVNVNGVRLSTSAGGQDDGESQNGALITVGGLGDDPANPADPFARGSQAGCPRCDDELYDLSGFVSAANVTELELTTTNDSADDNFMFAALYVEGATVTWTSSADPCAGIDIVICYAPELRFHPREQYFPMDASAWILGTELRWAADLGCGDRSLGTAVTDRNLTNDTYRHYEISNGLCRERRDDTWYRTTQWTRPFGDATAPNGEGRATQEDGDLLPRKEGFYLKYVDDVPATGVPVNRVLDAPVYVEQRPDRLIYWYFYGEDPKSFFFGDGFLAHQGDWERIEVVLENGRASSVEFFGHGCSTGVVNWPPPASDVTDGTHIHVYPAEGTHASYPFAGRDIGSDLCETGKGLTDETRFDENQSVIWQTWNGTGVVAVESQCWYGFGGAWGNTSAVLGFRGDATGPAGPPFNGKAPRLPATGVCDNPIGKLVGEPSPSYTWLDKATLAFTGGTPGLSFTTALASVPLRLSDGVVGPDGTTTIEVQIPPGTEQGMHDIIIRSTETGEDLFFLPVQVDIPERCATGSAADDVDGDGVRDVCDPNPVDGPTADADVDGVVNALDNCPTIANPDQSAVGERSDGTACDRRDGFNPVPHYLVVDYLAGPFCDIFVPTIIGTPGDDQINGTNGDDIIYAGEGNDSVNALSGDDIVCGGPGQDALRGQNGNDVLYGQAGVDDLKGQQGDDILIGGGDGDSLKGGSGNDELQP